MTAPEQDCIVETRNLTRSYVVGGEPVVALDRVSVRIRRGDYVSFMGPSGSGKTTLLNLLGCIDRPTEGQTLIDGRVVSDLTDRDLDQIRLRKIGFIFQRVNLIPVLTALENVELPMELAGIAPAERKKRAAELLGRVGLDKRIHHRSSQLSAGEQQRVGIARSLCNCPSILLADEPTGNLDSKNGEEIAELFQTLNREQGQTIVIVTHDLEIGAQAKTRHAMRDGRIVETKEG